MSEHVGGSVDALVRGARDRVPLEGPGKSGALLERVLLEDGWHVLKHLDHTRDWTLRAAGVPGGAVVELWRRGLLARLPAVLDHAIVAVAQESPERAALLMRDVGEHLVPVSDEVVPPEQHEAFLDHMAALHATFWEAGPEIEVVSPADRYLELSPRMVAREAARGAPGRVPRLVAEGWPLLGQVAPTAARIVTPLVDDPRPLLAALAATPHTLVHGNWKLDNLGTGPDGRTVLLDWETSGRGAPASDLAWYLAINCRRLPTSKEAAIASYRAALERHGLDTGPWWDRQLRLCLLGALVQFGWEKALGGYDDELAWWEEQAVRAEELL